MTAENSIDPSSPSSTPDRSRERTIEWLAAVLSLAAAAVHFGYAPHHLADDWAHGWFFLVLGAFQLAFAVLIVSRPRRWVWLAAVIVNLGAIVTWIVSRTVGLPFGPEDLRSEATGFPDVVATVIEGLVVVLALVAVLAPTIVRRPTRHRSFTIVGATAIGIVAIVIASISLTPTYTAAHEAGGHSHGETAGDGGDTPCELAGAAASPEQVQTDGEGHSHRGPTAQVALTKDERDALEQQQLLARAAVAKYPTVASAEAAGYRKSTAYVPCIGAHYTNIRYVLSFDPATPSELLYDGTTPESRIVGLSFLVYHPGGPPEGFAGANDVWHQHNSNGGLCQRNGLVIGAESLSAEECAARGGRKVANENIWMVHDWVAPGWECSWGVFAAECPELGGRVGGSAWDAPLSDANNANLTGTN